MKAKRSSWRSLLTQVNHNTPLSKIRSLVRSLSGKRSITILPELRVHGRSITEPKEILNTIADNFIHCSSSENYAPGFLARSRIEFRMCPRLLASDNTEAYNTAFTISVLRDAISSSCNTSMGPDNLHYAFSDVYQKPIFN